MTEDKYQWTQELKGLHGKGGDTYCGPGWRRIVEDCDEQLWWVTGGRYRVEQIKEKFGTLRFYWSLSNSSDPWEDNIMCNICEAIVSRAEAKSGRTCEECGTENYKDDVTTSAGDGYWIKTLCANCRAEKK